MSSVSHFASDPFTVLSPELLRLICSHLSSRDIIALGSTSKTNRGRTLEALQTCIGSQIHSFTEQVASFLELRDPKYKTSAKDLRSGQVVPLDPVCLNPLRENILDYQRKVMNILASLKYEEAPGALIGGLQGALTAVPPIFQYPPIFQEVKKNRYSTIFDEAKHFLPENRIGEEMRRALLKNTLSVRNLFNRLMQQGDEDKGLEIGLSEAPECADTIKHGFCNALGASGNTDKSFKILPSIQRARTRFHAGQSLSRVFIKKKDWEAAVAIAQNKELLPSGAGRANLLMELALKFSSKKQFTRALQVVNMIKNDPETKKPLSFLDLKRVDRKSV